MLVKLTNLAVIILFAVCTTAMAAEPREVLWEDLMPEGWIPPEPEDDPSLFFDTASPAAQQLSPDAPVVAEMDGQYVKIPGFILPVEYSGDSVSEFLLVPYVGACLHVPPPPSNQVVYVRLEEPLAGTDLYDPIWVYGDLRVESTDSIYARSAYAIDGKKIGEYVW